MSNSIVRVILTGDAKGLQMAAMESTKSLEKTGKASGTAGGRIKAGLAIGAGAAIAFGVDAVKAYMGAEEAQTHLEIAIKNSGSTWEAHKKAIDAAVTSGQAFGYDQGQIMASLAQMTTSFGSPTKALNTLQLAENLAALKGMDLQTASMLVTKGLEGQIKPLKALGLDIPVAAGGALKLKVAQDKVAAAEANLTAVEAKVHSGRLKGPAAAAALTTATDKLKAAQDHLSTVQSTARIIQAALTKDTAGAATTAANTFTGKLNAQTAAWRNVKIDAGRALSGGLIKFQEWSQKTGRPEIMRLQGAIHSIAMEFGAVFHAIGNVIGALGAFGNAVGKIVEASPLGPANPHPTPTKGSMGGGGGPNWWQQPGSGGPQTNVVVNVQGADPNAVARAVAQQSRRNGTG